MNTTTNTRGVSEAMVERAKQGWRNSIETDGQGASFDTRIRAALEAALSAPEPAAQGEAVNVPGYDVGWKIRGVTAYNEAKRKGYRHPECVEAAIKAAPPAQPAERVPEGLTYQARALSDRSLGEAGWMAIDRDGMFKHPSHFDYRTLASPAPSEGRKGVEG